MTREDVLKRRVRAAAPSPSPLFSNGVRKVLDELPKRKRMPVLRVLSMAAVAVAGLAMVYFAVVFGGSLGSQPGRDVPLAAGQETTATPSDLSSPAETQDGGYQAGDRPFSLLKAEDIATIEMVVYKDQPPEDPDLYKVITSEQAEQDIQALAGILNGIEVKKEIQPFDMPVGATGYLMQVSSKDGTQPMLQVRLYGNDILTESGRLYQIEALPDLDAAFEALAGEAQLMQDPTPMPGVTPAPVPSGVESTGMPAQETPTPTPAPTPTPREPDATAEMLTTYVPGTDADADKRNCALGNVCEFAYAVKTDTGIDYVINGQTTEGLMEYCDRYFRANKNSPKKHELDPKVHPNLLFVLIDGLVDKNFVGTTISEDKLNLLISAGEDAEQYGVYTRGMLNSATLEFFGPNEYETFVLTIHNTNPSFRPTSNFTILTRYAPADGEIYTVADWLNNGDGKVQYYALPVSGK